MICNRYAKEGRKEKSENSKTGGGLVVTGNKFICKQAMKYDMTKSQRNFASAARPCWQQTRAHPPLPQPPWQRDGAEPSSWDTPQWKPCAAAVGKAVLLHPWQPVWAGRRRFLRMRAPVSPGGRRQLPGSQQPEIRSSSSKPLQQKGTLFLFLRCCRR